MRGLVDRQVVNPITTGIPGMNGAQRAVALGQSANQNRGEKWGEKWGQVLLLYKAHDTSAAVEVSCLSWRDLCESSNEATGTT